MEHDDDDIYCDEEPRQNLDVERHSEGVVVKSRQVGERQEGREQVADVIPKLKTKR
jgi:hypothetical protein